MRKARDGCAISWLRPDQLADEIAAVASSDLGRQFIDGKVVVAVASIRELVGR
jgi:hypothetical protein